MLLFVTDSSIFYLSSLNSSIVEVGKAMRTPKVSKKKKLQTLPILLRAAQRIFNEWIRLRDKGDMCISCGSDKANQAGHYFPVSQYSALRFVEENVNLQCSYCNCYMHGNQANYRMGLETKLGEDAVRKLEKRSLTDRARSWKRAEVMQIIAEYEKRVERIKNGV